MQLKETEKRERKHEKGAIVIEATMSLTFFMFLIITMLSIVNICILQQKVGVALNQTAKEIAQYIYIYNLTGLNEVQQESYERGEEARGSVNTIVDSVSSMAGSLNDFSEGDASFADLGDNLSENVDQMEQTVDAAIESGSGWVMSFLYAIGNEGFEAIKGSLGGALARGLIQKNLESEGVNAKTYLLSRGVMNETGDKLGLDGIDFSRSVLMLNGGPDIVLVADYHVKVITLFDHDITLHFRQAAVTRGWMALPLESGAVDETAPAGEAE